MPEREKVCILCGRREKMVGYICTICQDRIQQEAVNRQPSPRNDDNGDIQGANPDEGHKGQG